MSNEARVYSSIQLKKGNRSYRSNPASFLADVSSGFGPTPGEMTATEDGVDVDLSKLTSPGLCRIMNTGDTYPAQVGIYNSDQSEFYPLLRLLPGETYAVRLDPDLNKEYAGTGTGTTAEHNSLRVKGVGGSTTVLVEAFDS